MIGRPGACVRPRAERIEVFAAAARDDAMERAGRRWADAITAWADEVLAQ